MRQLRLYLPSLCLALLACLPARAASGPEPSNWTLQQARQAALQIDTARTLAPLFQLARAGQNSALLEQLRLLSGDERWPLPARERALQEFAVGLGDLPVDAVSAEVTDFLLNHEPRVWVPDEEHGAFGVPLYNVAAAAAGVVYDWARLSAAHRAGALWDLGTGRWLEAYRAAGAVERSGFVDSLGFAARGQLGDLAGRALDALPARPDLTPVVARCATLLNDATLLQGVLRGGSGPSVAPALRAAAASLDESDRAAVLRDAIQGASAVNASLALGELAPGLLGHAETVELLLDLLGDRELGAGAALALSRSADPRIGARLAELAGGGEGLISQRAALARRLRDAR